MPRRSVAKRRRARFCLRTSYGSVSHPSFFLQQDEASIAAVTRRVTPIEKLDVVAGDPADNRVLECAVAAGSETVVTGDADLLRLGTFRGIKILKPAGPLFPIRLSLPGITVLVC